MRHTTFHKALLGEIDLGHPQANIQRAKELASEIKIMDVIDPTSRQIGLLAELIARVRESPELELIEIEGQA